MALCASALLRPAVTRRLSEPLQHEALGGGELGGAAGGLAAIVADVATGAGDAGTRSAEEFPFMLSAPTTTAMKALGQEKSVEAGGGRE
jgi:hypothetical protein